MGITAYLPDHDPVFIASWKGFRVFCDGMDSLGAEHFPMVFDHLPDGDEGETAPEYAAQMLAELHYFTAHQTDIQEVILVDSERGDDLSRGNSIMGGRLTMDRVSGYDLGFDERGFFVRDRWELNRDLFRAMRVEQQLLRPEQHQVIYIDRDSGQQFQCSVPLGKAITGEDGLPRMYLRYVHVEIRQADNTRFAYILKPLLRVLEAAVEQDLTIRWG